MERDGLRTCVPVHGNRTLKIGTISAILRDIGMGPSDLRRRL